MSDTAVAPEMIEQTETEIIEVRKIREAFPNAIIAINEFRGDTRIMVERDKIADICRFLRDSPELQYNFLSECLGVDYLDFREDYRFEVVYNLYSMELTRNSKKEGFNRRIFLKIGVPKKTQPRRASLPSIPARISVSAKSMICSGFASRDIPICAEF